MKYKDIKGNDGVNRTLTLILFSVKMEYSYSPPLAQYFFISFSLSSFSLLLVELNTKFLQGSPTGSIAHCVTLLLTKPYFFSSIAIFA